jgi:bifunctional NMN adenylyltransferase/nudix hydrolase
MDMNEEIYDVLVYVGRFQPFHNGHLKVIENALKRCNHLIILIGSAYSPRTIKNPFSYKERKQILKNISQKPNYKIVLKSSNNIDSRVFIDAIEDSLYSNADWITRVYNSVNSRIKELGLIKPTIGLVGVKKDYETSEYINFFGSWDFVDVPLYESNNGKSIDSTKIRELYFSGHLEFVKSVIPSFCFKFLQDFQNTEDFKQLKQEYDDAIKYDHQFDSYPKNYALNFLTVDAVVVQSGHVLLVKRGKSPGKGLWALPGGHVNANETLDQAVIRELREETKIKVPEKVLKGSIVYSKIFDHPSRSLRGRILRKNGRTITNAYLIKLDDSQDLPNVVGSDDACKAWWFTFAEVKQMRDKLFEDHYDLILHMLGRI